MAEKVPGRDCLTCCCARPLSLCLYQRSFSEITMYRTNSEQAISSVLSL